MYRALYRKWRPAKFKDVVGQDAIVAALQNQVEAGRIGHAYLFTGTRGTGKTSCAKIFAKAVNCPECAGGDPCGVCPVCRGIDDGSILDVVEIDAASNSGVDNIRDLRDETAYTPSVCRYKVYIIDEVHMLSGGAFNALLKIMEEPPAHVIFILATTEIHKVPATILSRCQRYDFARIQPAQIAARLAYIAGEEGLRLTDGAAALIARLADGAMRDALSILDTCAGGSAEVDEELVRRMAGVTERGYLFSLSDALAAGDAAAALAEVAALRQRSVDLKRLCEELAGHYRSLMLAALPGGEELLPGADEEERQNYLRRAKTLPQSEAVRAIRQLGAALERMGRSMDPRIELELALLAIAQPPAPAAAPALSAAGRQSAAAPAQPFAVSAPAPAQPFRSQPAANPPAAFAPPPASQPAPMPPAESGPAVSAPKKAPAAEPRPLPAGEDLPPWEEAPAAEQPMPNTAGAPAAAEPPAPPREAAPGPAQAPESPAPNAAKAAVSPAPSAPPQQTPPAPGPASPAPSAPPAASGAVPSAAREQAAPPAGPPQPFAPWPQVLARVEQADVSLFSFLRASRAYLEGRYVLIDGGEFFRDYIRKNKASQALLKQIIEEVSGRRYPIGPWQPPETAPQAAQTLDDTLKRLNEQGVEIVDKETE